ncbi:MAG: hypothetical protein AAGF30_15730 [Pseudomonadota bacterium]
MEPIAFSLLSLSSSGMAIRRLTAAMEAAREAAADPVADRLSRKPRQSVLAALSTAIIRPRRLVSADAAPLVNRITRFAADNDLSIGMQVSLASLFELQGDSPASNALSRRRADMVLMDKTGAPLCGLELADQAGPAFRDHIRARAFEQANLPLLSVPVDADWSVIRDRLEAILPTQTAKATAVPHLRIETEPEDAEVLNLFADRKAA